MSKEKLVAIVRAILLTFALVSIGVFIGRITATPPADEGASVGDSVAVDERASDAENQPSAAESKLIVYSMHPTARCMECLQIEALTKKLVDDTFAQELADGSVEFRSVDYFKNPGLARKYNVATSTVVVAYHLNGKETYSERLDDVWTKVRDEGEFASYIFEAILRAMERGRQ